MESVWPVAMTVSRLIEPACWATWSRTCLPSGFRVDLSKSKNVSAFRTTLLAVGATTGASATGLPQPSAAVAGVQNASRQQFSPLASFQTWPSTLVQLSDAEEEPSVAMAAMASPIAILEGLFMFLLV